MNIEIELDDVRISLNKTGRMVRRTLKLKSIGPQGAESYIFKIHIVGMAKSFSIRQISKNGKLQKLPSEPNAQDKWYRYEYHFNRPLSSKKPTTIEYEYTLDDPSCLVRPFHMFSYRNVAVCKRLVVELHFDKAADQPKSVHVFDRDSNDLPRKPGDQLVEINSGDGRFTVARKPIPGYKISILSLIHI